jgi:hypothetical protein
VGKIVSTHRALGTGALICGAEIQSFSESAAHAQFVGATVA